MCKGGDRNSHVWTRCYHTAVLFVRDERKRHSGVRCKSTRASNVIDDILVIAPPVEHRIACRVITASIIVVVANPSDEII